MGLLTKTYFFFSLVACCYRSETQKRMNYELGKKLPATPFMILKELGFQMCFKECEAYFMCVSINYHLQHFICELNSVRKDSLRPLVSDQDYAYHEIPRPANKTCGTASCNLLSKCVKTSLGRFMCVPFDLDCITSWCSYGGRSYLLSNQTLSWQNAKENCNQMNAHLVEIQTAEEHRWIISIISDWHWIGLTDLNSEGVWIWNHSRTVNSMWDYFFKYEIESYDCVVMPSGKWNNWHCSTKFYFICEK